MDHARRRRAAASGVWHGRAALLLFVMFQAVFAWAKPAMELISPGFDGWARFERVLPEGLLRSFVQNGMISGVGSVLVFLPQILVLFLLFCCSKTSAIWRVRRS